MAGCVLVTTLATSLDELVGGQVDARALVTIVGFYLATSAIIVAFAVWTAAELGLPSLLVLSPLSTAVRWRRIASYGVGIGLLLAVGSVGLAGGGSPALRPWFWQRIQTPLETVLFTARGALLEETFFRLFLIPFLVSLALRARLPRYRLEPAGGVVRATRSGDRPPARLPVRPLVAGAIVVSSLLFGLAHPDNPLPAMLLSPLLAVAYLRGGWESAVLAHFVANWIVFAVYY